MTYAWMTDPDTGRQVFRRVKVERVQRSDLPFPMVISDEMPETEHLDGNFYTSKRRFREVTRAHGCIEIGNEKLKPKEKTYPDRKAIRETIRRARQKVFS